MNRMKVVQKKPMRKIAIGFLAVLATAYVVHAQAPSGGLEPAAVQELLTKFNVPGVSIAVIKDFKIEWARGYGIADVETGAPVTPDTMFQAASISKPVAAMVSLRAVQDRRFTLDQDINTILKSWKLPGRPLTKEQSRHAAHADEPHIGHGRRIRLSRLRAGHAAANAPADAGRRCRRPIAGAFGWSVRR